MVDIEKISETAMEIISYSGLAKSCYLEALHFAKTGDFLQADEKIKEGDKSFVQAHYGHGGLLQEEMEVQEPRISLLMTHAEDQLMGAEMSKTFIMELMDLYKNQKKETSGV